MQSLGEMATWLPLPGAIPQFCTRYVDPAMGFAVGWNVSLTLPTLTRDTLANVKTRIGFRVHLLFVRKSRRLLWLSNTGMEPKISMSLRG